MDELALLKDFRLEDAAVDGAREHARAALRRAMPVCAVVTSPHLCDGARATIHWLLGLPPPPCGPASPS